MIFTFTFHYGRIQSMPQQSDSSDSGSFTFHYGRIQSLVWSREACWSKEFTFHYGRIQSEEYGTIKKTTFTFTFHYGRIQSCTTTAALMGQTDLHSIMVGFNLEAYKLPGYDNIIYIPLWSDSIQKQEQMLRSEIRHLHSIMVGFNPMHLLPDSIVFTRFTFHYGRIQSSFV